jgi:hypothetical protein
MLWIVPASVVMDVSTTISLMAIPKHHLILGIGNIVSIIFSIVRIVI